jgi:hypothetical protein
MSPKRRIGKGEDLDAISFARRRSNLVMSTDGNAPNPPRRRTLRRQAERARPKDSLHASVRSALAYKHTGHPGPSGCPQPHDPIDGTEWPSRQMTCHSEG